MPNPKRRPYNTDDWRSLEQVAEVLKLRHEYDVWRVVHKFYDTLDPDDHEEACVVKMMHFGLDLPHSTERLPAIAVEALDYTIAKYGKPESWPQSEDEPVAEDKDSESESAAVRRCLELMSKAEKRVQQRHPDVTPSL